ncbi:MAG: hypothetical protein KAV82_05830 [Phycisphaerae bacterium]|nr:hypothetical protein [Phycisphaerae bacterium]
MASEEQKDLIILVPGKDEAAAIRGILSRPRAMKIRPITVELQQHPERDPGCRLRGHEFLRRETGRFAFALVLFDREGCGAETESREAIEGEVQRRLAKTGWGDRVGVIVIDPELEAWVWNDTSHVDELLGWQGQTPSLREWLVTSGFLSPNDIKPRRPKEAMEKALRQAEKKRSSAIYGQLAEKVSFKRCVDPAFVKLRTTLQNWFPEEIDS